MLEELPEKLRRRPFSYREACDHGLTQYALQKLIEAGVIERLERGVYCAFGMDPSEEQMFRIATKIAGKQSAVCLLSALSYYDLADAIPRQVWLMVPDDKRTNSKFLKLYRSRNPMWKVGIIESEGYCITSLERSVVDALTLKTLVPQRLGIDALKRAIADKQASAGDVLRMADLLEVKARVLPFIEAVS